MTDEEIAAASKEITAFVRELIKPWVEFRVHEAHFAQIIAKQASTELAAPPVE